MEERMEDRELVAAIRAGNESAFGQMAERYRRELQIHCYRMLGSLHEAEDLVQDAFLRAWRSRSRFEGRSTFRAWLYRIATNACLDFLDRHPRRPGRYGPSVGQDRPTDHTAPPMVPWLEPIPDRSLDGTATDEPEPGALVVARETIELAFLVAIQHLPPRQRAALIMRDVLGWSAAETAVALDTTPASVKSALQRARTTLREHLPERRDDWSRPTDPSPNERALLTRYVEAHERGDAHAVAELLAEEVRLTMPPHPLWFAGRDSISMLHAEVFDPASPRYHGQWRGIPTQANRQPAVAHYCRYPSAAMTREHPGRFRAQVLDVLRIVDGRVAEITAFEPPVFLKFGLPLALP